MLQKSANLAANLWRAEAAWWWRCGRADKSTLLRASLSSLPPSSPPSHLGRTALHPSFARLDLLASRMQDLKLVWLCGWRKDHQSHLLIHHSKEAFKNLLSLRLLPAILVYEILQIHRLLSFYRSRVFAVFGCWTQDQDNKNTSNKDKNNDNPGDL